MPPTDASDRLLVVLVGGGSGGHIFPNLAISEALSKSDASIETKYICSERAIDRAVLESAGVDFTPIPAQPLSARPRALMRFVRRWGESVRASRALLQSIRKTHRRVVVVMTGGFVSAPAANAARAERIPLALVNLDAVPGKANRWAGRIAQVRMTIDGAAPDAWTRIRPIVRAAAIANDTPGECRARVGLDPALKTLLVTGASQGATSINRFMQAFAESRSHDLSGWQVLHQAGAGAADSLTDAYEKAGVRSVVTEFVPNIGDAWGAADLAVARAGAGIVGEVWANAVPTLFFPYPYHRDQHQRRNAAPLADCGGGIVVTDHVDPDRNLADAGAALAELLGDSARRVSMHQALRGLGPTDGAATVAREAIRLGETPDGAYRVRQP